jgi:hypothetical protein
MKTAILISIVLTTMIAARAQQAAPNRSVAPAQTVPDANMPPPAQNMQPPDQNQTAPSAGAAMVDTNEFNNNTNTTMPGQDTNQFAATNPPPTMQRSNNFAATGSFAITNRLSTMAPAQAQTVVQVQVGLNTLQQIAVNIGPVPNVQEVIFQNPQARQQVRQFSGQIIALARGRARPTFDSVDRLTLDLLRACSRSRWEREHQLVLAMLVNDACNCENLTAAQFEESVNNGLMALRTAGVAPAFCNSIGCDLHSIAFEVQPSLAL